MEALLERTREEQIVDLADSYAADLAAALPYASADRVEGVLAGALLSYLRDVATLVH